MQGDESSAGIASASAVGSSAVVSLPTDEMPPVSEKGSDAGHGNRFQSKLLMLFCIRAINAEYKFYLGTELLDQGNKFDDLIFKFTKDGEWRYQYLQAKSRLNEKENKITAKDLFAVKKQKKGVNIDFSLPKYFRSYREIIRRGDEIDSCIICTNIDFGNKESLKEKGIEVKEVQLTDKILQFAKLSDEKNPTRYKLNISKEKFEILKEETTSKILAKMLWDFSDGNETKHTTKKLETENESVRNYHIALIKEKVIDLETKKFHEDFINQPDELTEGAKELRKYLLQFSENAENWKKRIFNFDENFGKTPLKEFNYDLPVAVKDEEIQGFLDKLIFAVNTPNEDELDDVLKSEVGNYFTLQSTDLQSAYVMNEMVNWFKRKDNIWLSSKEARTLFLDKTKNIMESIRLNDLSIDYKNQLKKDLMGLEFNNNSIKFMTDKLKPLFKDTSNSVITIGSESPRHTAVKLIAAIKTLPDFECDDSFLVTPSKRLNDEVEAEKFKHCLELKEDSHNLLVVVCDGEASAQNYEKYANLIPDGGIENKINKVVITCTNKSVEITDGINYTDLTDEFKQKLLSLKVSFQLKKGLGQQEIEDNKMTVRDLTGDKPEEVIDIDSIKELTQFGVKIIISSFDNTTPFDEQMYIKRKLKFPFHNKFDDEIAKRLDCGVAQLREECRISSDGHIEWLVEDKRKKEMIWEKIVKVANQSYSLKEIHEDDHLAHLNENKKKKSVVIISSVAGTGKSTLLSQYYKEIKKAKPDHWVIRINLVDQHEAILKLGKTVKRSNVVDYFVNQLHVIDEKRSFSRSLLRKRLETRERIVIMFDGFDEINDLCQEKAIELIKAITKESLANFERNDQIDFLTKYWEKELDLIGDKNGPIQQFAKSLVDRVSETLKDKESSFIGIPLQCRIIAECFQSEVRSTLGETSRATKLIVDLFDGQRFDLAYLYRLLMETKRLVFLEEKAQIPSSSVQNDIVLDGINCLLDDVEDHLTKLAIETIVTDNKTLETLMPPQSSYRFDKNLAKTENKIALNSLKFGLTFKNGDNAKVQFLHRTFPEYLFARYLYQGILLDEKPHNKLLENESIRILILKKILATPEHDGVQVFFNSMLKELVEVDKKWRDKIDNRNLPERIKKFTENFFKIFLRIPQTTYPNWYNKENAVYFSLLTGKTMIFTFLCDCLDATFDKKQIQNVMMKSFMNDSSIFSFKFFCNGKSKLFKRFINYFSDADKIVPELLSPRCCLPPSTLEYSQWNGEEEKETVHLLLQFMTNRHEAFDKYFDPDRGITIVPMLTFLIFNENYERHLKIFLGLLSRSKAYSDDFQFANLLKKAFCSKEHFIDGRIEKVLITLRGFNRQNLLTQLYGIVLAKEPESFRNIYQPLPLEGDCIREEEQSMDLNMLVERDSYRTSLLHRAAFYGDREIVDKILEKIRQNLTQENLKEQVVKAMARDEYGFTPFYVAAVRGQEEIYRKMLIFLKEVLHDDILEEHLIDPNGFVCRALYDAIESENLPMFQLILKAVKKELGQKKLLQILRLHKRYDSNSFFLECKTEELFNEMAKIVVRKEADVKDTDFFDLILKNDETIQFLKHIDATNLEGLLSLRGVDEFTKHFLDTISLFDSGVRYHSLTRQTINSRNLYSIGFPLLAYNLLRHFTKVQLEQFVETITSKNNWKTIGGTSHGVCISVDVNDPATAESITNHFLGLGWNREDLEFQDNAAALNCSQFLEDRFACLEVVLGIYDRLKCLNDSFLKMLLLHEDDKGFIMIPLSLEVVQRMLTHLSKESQEDVKQQWNKDNAPSMDTFFPLTMEQPNNDDIMSTARRWTRPNVLRFYLHYGSEVQLEEFVKTITFLRDIGVERRSVWSYIFEHCHKEEKPKEILKLVSEKTDIFGSDALKTILLHIIDEIPLLLKAVLWGLDIDAWLGILPEEIREEIQQFMIINAPGLIDRAFQNPQTHFKTLKSFDCYNRLNTLISILKYSEDKQRQKFVQNITSFDLTFPIQNPLYFSGPIQQEKTPIQQEKKCSIWAELFTHKYHDCSTDDISKMDKFMKCLSEKLGSNAVKELAVHNDGERPVIFYPALRGDEKLMEKMLKYLSVEDRKDVECQVDKFLEETSKIEDVQFPLIND
ncbi:hypothetical protein DAPPUDRAFT_97395 [Daphnia pulex]|uniref:NACHT domain-containing protein n=1 Tax=Daphnia pulex TaxID=6669 RepID=E9FZW2_DAPPU|nr:hypothetical protein DAPPUDRAFT_97395 [Daphnia pulex]|eukprot:EFX87117.1 hypothetical protein DAPPUDRAFT_97395 [Daphnia pulex]